MKQIFFLLSFYLLTGTLKSQQELPSFLRDSLDSYITAAMEKEQLPGLAVCIVKDGRVVLMKGYGVTEVGGSDKVDENTLFMIGSNTKAFTALAMALLQEEGKLSLNDRISKWLPNFKMDNKLAGEQAIIRDVLSHRLGFKTFQGDFTYWKSDLSRQEIVERLQYIKAPYPFRTKYGYCNAGFVVAGEIIPLACGMSWEQFVDERFFKPLGMNNTVALSVELPSAKNKAHPHSMVDYRISKVPYGLIDNMAPAGSICSSVSDMSKWISMLLDKGKINGVQVYPGAAFDEVWYPHTIIGNSGSNFNKQNFNLYGLGFDLNDFNGMRKISHTGGVTGFLSNVILIPEKRLGVVVLTNSMDNTLFYSLGEELTDIMLGLPYRNYAVIYGGYTSSQVANKMKLEQQYRDTMALKLQTDVPLEQYVGTYTNPVYGKMEIVSENGELRMKFEHHPMLSARLEHISGGRFFASFNDPDFGKEVCIFKTDMGKVVSASVKVADFLEYDPYVFVKN